MTIAHPALNGHTEALRFIPLTYNNNVDSRASALRLVLALFPEWEHTEGATEFIRFTDGITNTLLKAVKRRPGSTEDQIDQGAILLRAYGKGTEVLIDRDSRLLAQNNLAPPLLARFNNGLMYRFIQGRVCTSKDLTQEPIWRAVARRLGQWHATLPIISAGDGKAAVVQNGEVDEALSLKAVKSEASMDRIKAIYSGKIFPNVWTVLQKWILALPTSTEAELKRKSLLQAELERTVKDLGKVPGLGKDGFIFGHCDLLSGNVIVQPPSNFELNGLKSPHPVEVSFIDYEYATPSPAAFDIANHFAEWGGFECIYSQLPSRKERREFLRDYLINYYDHLHASEPTHATNGTTLETDSSTISPNIDSEVIRLFEEVELFRGIPGFYWGIWALIQATISQIDFDYASYAEIRLGEYFSWRAEADGSRLRAGKALPEREKFWARDE